MTPCPLCGGGRSKSILSGSPYRRCCECGVVFNTAHSALSYSDSYFTDEYRAQYGKTYEEDFPVIYAAAISRIKRIKLLAGKSTVGSTRSVLDIGSALGFFLKAATDSGFTDVEGIEISPFAAGRCRNLFGFRVTAQPFESIKLTRRYNLITAWYFIEHCADTRGVISKIYDALDDGGVFAFSAPSTFGPLFLFSRSRWAASHPVDHKTDFTPRTARRALKKAGFRNIRIYAAGIHPERIMSRKNLFYPLFAFLYQKISRLIAFSDTIEVYAQK